MSPLMWYGTIYAGMRVFMAEYNHNENNKECIFWKGCNKYLNFSEGTNEFVNVS